MYSIVDFGAKADGKTLATAAFQAAITECAKNGGGTVVVPAGIYLTGPIEMQSNINLHVEAGAVIKFSNNLDDFPVITARWEGADVSSYMPLVYGKGLENISVTGRGTLDGQGAFWWHKKWDIARPRLISFVESKDILIEGIKLINSPAWTVNPVECENIVIDKVTVINPSNSNNTDGLNPDSCKNVRISNCHVDVGDDCITLKSGTEKNPKRIPCENITVTNCTMVHGHGGVVIGSEMSGDVRNVVISNCIFQGTDRGIRIKSRRGRGGVVEDIRVTNIVMEGVLCPVVLNSYYRCGADGDPIVESRDALPINEGTPRFRRIHLSNLTARECRAAAGYIHGLPELSVEDITLDNISIAMAADAKPGTPAMVAGLKPMKQKGFHINYGKNIRFTNVEIHDQDGEQFIVGNAENVTINGTKY